MSDIDLDLAAIRERVEHDQLFGARQVAALVDRIESLEARLARVTDDSPLAWADRHGDVWVFPHGDVIGYSFETQPFTRAHIEKKWGPLTPLVRAVAAEESAALSATPQNPVTGSYTVRTRKTARNGGAGFAADEQESPDA